MSAALDKSLDEIISSTRKSKKVTNKKKVAPKTVGKGVGKAQKPAAQTKAKAKAQAAAPVIVPQMDLTHATKVVAHGLPRDLKQDNIKIGGVQSISMSYNEKGNFKGIATIIFKSNKNAVKAVEKYHNAPIDGGASKLKMELVIDPSKRPLAARITANSPAATATDAKKKLKEKLQQKKKELQAKKKAAVSAKAVKTAKAKAAKPVKKTAEQLDQEMTEYFNN